MRLRGFLRLIFRELWNQKKFCLLFILNLSIGLVGFVSLDTFKTSLQRALSLNAKSFLSADLSLSARRSLRPEEIELTKAQLGPDFKEGRLWEFFSMVSAKDHKTTRLVQVKAIDASYPFYGELKLGSGKTIAFGDSKTISSQPAVWVYPELLSQLQLKVGDELQLGEMKYKIEDTVVDDSTQTFRLASMAPKIYVDIEMIKASGLVQRGTTFTEAYLFKLPDTADVEAVAGQIFKKVSDPGVQVTTAQQAGKESVRALGYLSDYLGLVSLVALFLSGIGAAFLFRRFFNDKIKALAIYSSLGLSLTASRLLLLGQVLILSLVSALMSGFLSLAFSPLLKELLANISPLSISLELSLNIFLTAVAMALFGSLSVSLPFFNQIGRVPVSQLFQESSNLEISWRFGDFALLLIPLLVFWLLGIWQANSIKIGSLFVGLLLIALLLMLALNWLLIRGLGKAMSRLGWFYRNIGLQLSRRSTRTLSGALALSLGSMLISLLPQLRSSVQAQIESPEASTLPALFLFDIQEEQLAGLQDLFKKFSLPSSVVSPMVRARILKVNGEPFEKATSDNHIQTREEETEARFRNRGFNLSYRDSLSAAEALQRGHFWTERFREDGHRVPEISLETAFAERLKLKLGDLLSFDVQGVEITGQVTSFRKVKWNSFQPNFFVLFQPGVLDEAPKSLLTSVQRKAGVDLEAFQAQLIESYPNVSAIDVKRMVEKVLSMVDKMSWSLQLMAALCLGVGFIVLYSIISLQVAQSRWDLNLLKILGVDEKRLLWGLVGEYGLVSFLAAVIGGALSLVMAQILSLYIFEVPGVVNGDSLLVIFSSVLGICFMAGILALFTALKVAKTRPQFILQS